MKTAIIADIQRASIHDGPGFRTTIFFKGCPLSCIWCHNPECIKKEPEILNYPEKCIGCGLCEEGCFSGAKVICGKEYTVDELMTQIRLDKPYYGTDGGVTFSGGEALLYSGFLLEVLRICKNEGISTAIETSLYIFDDKVLKNVDLVMADFKIWDDNKHIQYTGVSNFLIKENFIKLDTLDVPFVVRTPLIPTITDTVENISSIRNFIKEFKNVIKYELLEYNPLGNSKLVALGREKVIFEHEQTPIKELIQYANLQ